MICVFTFFVTANINHAKASPAKSQDAASTVISGSAGFQPDSNEQAPAGLAIFSYRSAGVLVSEAAVPASEPIRSGRIFAAIEKTATTGIALMNPNHEDVVVGFHFTDASGTDFGHGTFKLPAQNQMAAFLNESPFHGAAPLHGTFTFSSPLPVAAIALRGFTNERNEFLMTTLPVTSLDAAPDSATRILPHYADGGGWTSEVILTNPTDSTLIGTIHFEQAAGSSSKSSIDYSVSPRSASRFPTSGVDTQVQTGSVRVVPANGNSAPSSVALLSFRTGGVTVSAASVHSARSNLAFRMYVESLAGAGQTGSIHSGVAIANPSPFSVRASIEVAGLDGNVLGTGAVDVPANGQISSFINELLPELPATFQGRLRVSASTPIAVAGLRGRYNERGDFLITTTPPVDEASTSSNRELVFPHIVSGVGYTTQFILISRSSGESVDGLLSFRSKDGGILDSVETAGTTGAEVVMPQTAGQAVQAHAVQASTVLSPYLYNFNQDGVLRETGGMNDSTSPYWWVNSGAYLKFQSGRGWTSQGTLPLTDPWRVIYAASNPLDTDNGYHPQNIFRLTTRSLWQNARQEAYFVITANNLSSSPNRNASNGVLLFNRYLDGNNLYYTGVRVDGAAVIKKKRNGVYYTLAFTPGVYAGSYDRNSRPNLLPVNKWIGLRSEVINLPNGSVSIRLYIDKGWLGAWTLVAEAIDNGAGSGGVISSPGYAGIRTDFMDVAFENFRVRNF